MLFNTLFILVILFASHVSGDQQGVGTIASIGDSPDIINSSPSDKNPSQASPSFVVPPPPPQIPSPDPPSPSPPPDLPPPPPSPIPSPPPPPPDDRVTALLQFKAGITNANQVAALKSWQTNTDPCTWGGTIQCQVDGTITGINLPSTTPQMIGTISGSLANPALSTLVSIDLSGNKLTGAIPNDFNSNDTLPNLSILKLAGNQLIGGPPQFGTSGSKNLKQLDFNGNQLRAFPDWQFDVMEVLGLQYNLLNTNVPAFFGQVVPASGVVILMPQQGNATVCGTLPPGPTWAAINQNGQISPVTTLPDCNPAPPPPPMASPPAQSPPMALPPAPVFSVPPPSPVVSPPPPPVSAKGLSTGAIVGIAVGGAAGLVIIAILLYWCCRPNKTEDEYDQNKKAQYDVEKGSGYYTADGQWKGGAEGAASDLAAIATHRRNNSSGSGINSTSRDSSGFDPLLEWAQKAQGNDADAALAAAALGTVGSPTHGRSPSRGNLPLDVKLWTLNFRDMKIEKQIGEGSFGRVYLAKWNETPVAVKVLIGMANLEDEDAAEKAMTLSNPVLNGLAKESTMMAALRHPNVVGFLGICLSPPCMVTEFCARGSMTDVLRGGKSSPAKAAMLDWARRLNMALDAAKGMLYLHAHTPPIIHRDLKSPNLLVDKHWRVKVSDFNLSKLMDEGSVMSSMAATNPRWLAPEILTGNNATFASDVYSFAIVLWELLTWELPWGPTNPWQVVTVVTEGGRLEVPPREDLPGPDTMDFEGLDAYVTLMKKCWAHNPEDRPVFQEIISELRVMLSSRLAKTGKVLPAHPVSTVGEETPTKSVSNAQTASTSMRDGSKSAQELGETAESAHRAASGSVMLPATPPTPTVDAIERMDSLDVGMGVSPSPPGSPYASTTVHTGSILNPDDLNSGWATKLGSRFGRRQSKS